MFDLSAFHFHAYLLQFRIGHAFVLDVLEFFIDELLDFGGIFAWRYNKIDDEQRRASSFIGSGSLLNGDLLIS